MDTNKTCANCGTVNRADRYFCANCGKLLNPDAFGNKSIYAEPEFKIMRILENLQNVPHTEILWDDIADSYAAKVEKFQALYELPEMSEGKDSALSEKMMDFLEMCRKPEFQIAFVGTIKTGKSTLINALLGHNYASMAVTPETAALTKFRSSAKDYVRVTFYSQAEWKKLWNSVSRSADVFLNEYQELHADDIKDIWVGHKDHYVELPNDQIDEELKRWSSSRSAEHYFVKEIDVGISSLPEDFPKQVVFVDTPGLSDPVGYRSEITKQYIRKANAVFVCVDAQKLQREEIETISSVFSFSSHNKSKVHIIATHWDKLNSPVKDWEEQKRWFEKQLVGKAFFDSAELAQKNITYSAAYIYNICRDYPNISPDEKKSLLSFSIQMDLYPPEPEKLEEMKRLSNVQEINTIIQDELAGDYQRLLFQDMEQKYKDITHTLRRVSEDRQRKSRENVDATNMNLDKLEKKVRQKKKDYDEVKKCADQLTALQANVHARTQQRLSDVLAMLDRQINAKQPRGKKA